MSFAKLSAANADKLIDEFKIVKKQHTDLNKGTNKLLKKSEIATLEKKAKELGQKASVELATNMKSARGYFEKHAQDVQNWMLQCVQLQKTQMGALERFKKSPTQIFERGTVERAVDEIDKVLKVAQAQDKEYGVAWSEFRSYNPVKVGLEEVYAKDFVALRMKLMNDGKAVTGKIDRMESMVTEARSIAAKAEGVAKAGAEDIVAARARAKKLATDAEAILNQVNNAKGNNISVLKNGAENVIGITGRMKPTTEVLANVRDGVTNIVTADKFIRNQITLLTKMTTTIKSTFDAEELKDGEIKKSLQSVETIAADVKKMYEERVPNIKAAIEAAQKFTAQAKKK